MGEFKINVRATGAAGEKEPKDLVKAIKVQVAAIMTEKGVPGVTSIPFELGPIKGIMNWHANASESSGRLGYYIDGTVDVGPYKGLSFGGNVGLPKDDFTNFLDQDSHKLLQVAKKAAKSEKEQAKLTPEEAKLLIDNGVTLKHYIKK